MDPQRYQVRTEDGTQTLGVVVNHGRGWRYIPWSDTSTSSRKLWDTPQQALKGRVKQYTLVQS